MVKYSPEAINQAYSQLDNRRQKAISEYSEHVDEIKRNAPEIYSIFMHLADTKNRLAEIVFSKRDDVKQAVEAVKNDNLLSQKRLKEYLVRFGYPEDYLVAKYHCNTCCDTGLVEGQRCRCCEELLMSIMIKQLNEQCKIKLHSFAEFKADYYPETFKHKGKDIACREMMVNNLQFCMKYCDIFSNDSPSIFMIGQTGLGKTFLSSCIAQTLILSGVSVAFDSIQNYLRDIEKEHFGKSDKDTLEILLNADLLILDDLGCEFSSPFNSSTIYNIINSRLNMGKPTIVSTNLTNEELVKRYDDRIISRLIGNYYPLRFVGEDIRQIKRRNGIFN